MGINETKCDACGAELDAENYYYIYAGRLQQGPMSDPNSNMEYTLCMTCYSQLKTELMVSLQRQKQKTQGRQDAKP
ncbi:MAG: hypothetical protein KGH98_04520 [Candidatus Micrarchaeota archaeon]|nr:hypothetical protein [Candidatus Micrarchaeota archaeon]